MQIINRKLSGCRQRQITIIWTGALQLMQSFLGNYNHKLSEYVIDVFSDLKRK